MVLIGASLPGGFPFIPNALCAYLIISTPGVTSPFPTSDPLGSSLIHSCIYGFCGITYVMDIGPGTIGDVKMN